jgi:hypothetical protein
MGAKGRERKEKVKERQKETDRKMEIIGKRIYGEGIERQRKKPR